MSAIRCSFIAGTKRHTGESSFAESGTSIPDAVTNITASSRCLSKSADVTYSVPSRVGFFGHGSARAPARFPADVLLPV